MTSVCRISRRLILVLAVLLVLGHSGHSQTAASNFSFLVVGDWGTGSSSQREVAVAMGKVAESIGARFVISTGDNFYPRGVERAQDAQWQTKFEEVYTAPALMIPWYAVLGNHDHKGNVRAQVDYTKLSPRWRMPASYYKHTEILADGSTADFIYLDTDAIINFYKHSKRSFFSHDKQLDWLRQELAASSARWKIVAGHHPVISGG